MFFKNKYFFYGALIALGLLIFFSGFFFGRRNNNNKDEEDKGEQKGQIKEIRQSGYNFINPLLECEAGGEIPILKLAESKMKKLIQDEIIDKNSDIDISLYYRDLKNGPWFGINEQVQYSPASLLKVPLMITYLKYSQDNPDILKREILFDKISEEFSQQVRPSEYIQIGKSYTVEQLIDSMIKYSDNEATNLLFRNINPNDLNLVFSDLGISVPDIYDINNAMSVKDYSSFFRILYNSSYLNRGMSEQSLAILASSEYDDGLVAGVPTNILVSHKFGERESLTKDNKIIKQLHDCGIVYHPTRPYLICIMTKGDDFVKLSGVISDISKVIYNQINE